MCFRVRHPDSKPNKDIHCVALNKTISPSASVSSSIKSGEQLLPQGAIKGHTFEKVLCKLHKVKEILNNFNIM